MKATTLIALLSTLDSLVAGHQEARHLNGAAKSRQQARSATQRENFKPAIVKKHIGPFDPVPHPDLSKRLLGSVLCLVGSLVGGKCYDLQNDESNCGSVGTVCTVPTNGVSNQCNSGVCTPICPTSYTLSSDKRTCNPACSTGLTYNSRTATCVNLLTDANNCRTLNNVCSTTLANAVAVCNAGTCSTTCASNYSLVNNVCQPTCKDGSVWNGSSCTRTSGCTTNAQCISASGGNSQSYCFIFPNGGYCFTPSTNSAGLAQGSVCGYSGNLNGDDNSCAAGGVCINYKCQVPPNVMTDVNNCKYYGTVCATPTNGSPTCTLGVCGISCNAGYIKSTDGLSCIGQYSADVTNCGAASNNCITNAGPGYASGATCTAGVCGPVTCKTGYNQSSDKKSCVSAYLSDVLNCGSSGNSCASNAGLGYVAGSASCVAGVCTGIRCQTNYSLVGLACVSNFLSDPLNCGSAGYSCASAAGVGYLAGSATCVSGICKTIQCTTGYTLSTSGLTCISSYLSDPLNCGRLSNNCGTNAGLGYVSGSATCVNGVCSTIRCSTGYSLSTNGLTCVSNYLSDVANCGALGSSCITAAGIGYKSGASCVGGVCQAGVLCNNGYVTSSDGKSCVSAYLSDVLNCGSSGFSCATAAGLGFKIGSAVCTAGKCSVQCNTGFSVSSDGKTCISLYASDLQNCGTVGNSCSVNAGQGFLSGACVNGVCSNIVCSSGYTLSSNGLTCSAACKDGAVLSGTACVRSTGCTADSQCISAQGGTSSSYCYIFPGDSTGYCFTPSTNSAGLPVGSACGWNSWQYGDDNQCTSGAVCINHICVKPPNVQTDITNCGKYGNVCATVTNGAPTCTAGACGFTCNTSFVKSTDGLSCVAQYSNDILNCGGVGKVCATLAGIGYLANSATCTNSKCSVRCSTGYTLSSDSTTCTSSYLSDPLNCGSLGRNCATLAGSGVLANSATCSNGICAVRCSTGYTLSSDSTTCTSSYLSDPLNCGSLGRNCGTLAGAGYLANSATCTAGVCNVQCQSGYTLNNGVCTAVTCKDGTYFSNGQCLRYTCGSDGDCKTKTGLTATACFNGSCFVASTNSGGKAAGSSCGGATQAPPGDDNSCAAGLVCVYYTCYNPFLTDVNNCGSYGNKCGSVGVGGVTSSTCQNGKCVVTCSSANLYTTSADASACVCLLGYTANSGNTKCVLSASVNAKVGLKKRKEKPAPSLCPSGETACPIAGSSSFDAFTHSSNKVQDFLSQKGGYECLNTMTSPESCGGCASTGSGVDCTKIANNSGVGCNAGQCIVFSCERGFAPSSNNKTCILKKHSGRGTRHAKVGHLHGKKASHGL